MPLPVTDSEKNAWPIAQIQVMGFFSMVQSGVNMNLYPSAAPGRNDTRMARMIKMTKNTGIMILLLFSMLFAPSNKVRSVATTTITWKGTTEYSVVEKLSNQVRKKLIFLLFHLSISWYIVIDSSNSHLQIYLLLSINLLIRGWLRVCTLVLYK